MAPVFPATRAIGLTDHEYGRVFLPIVYPRLSAVFFILAVGWAVVAGPFTIARSDLVTHARYVYLVLDCDSAIRGPCDRLTLFYDSTLAALAIVAVRACSVVPLAETAGVNHAEQTALVPNGTGLAISELFLELMGDDDAACLLLGWHCEANEEAVVLVCTL